MASQHQLTARSRHGRGPWCRAPDRRGTV